VAGFKEDAARQALGLLGHELATPLARLGSTAESALVEIHQEVARTQDLQASGNTRAAASALDDLRSTASGYLERIRLERLSVGAAMRMAPIVAQEADGRLELQFEEFDLGQLVLHATAQASDECNSDPTSGEGDHRYTFRFNVGDSVRSLGRAVGDSELLTVALINILRNAAKYSIAPPQRHDVDIDVIGEPQSGMKIVVVRNMGRGIAADDLDLIFEPWVRRNDPAGVVARRGMGLGLFLSRRIAFAHGGTVLCRRSSPLPAVGRARPGVTGPDEKLDRMIASAFPAGARRQSPLLDNETATPQASLQRYMTEFELRIKTGHTIGAQVHEWRTRSATGMLRSGGGQRDKGAL